MRLYRLSLIVLALFAAELHAQRALVPQRRSVVQPAIRADVIIDRDVAAQLAAGIAVAAAYNVRIALDIGAGAVWRDGEMRPAGRGDVLLRWLSDPFRQSHWGLSAGGGVGFKVEDQAAPRAVALITLGLEGPARGPFQPGVEVGLGGGVRIGVTLRRSATARRR
jgi:hypothetical protein